MVIYEIDGPRLLGMLDALADFGKDGGGGITRPAYSPCYEAAAEWLIGQMREAGLATHMDGAGNIIGRIGGKGPVIALGSHIDTVPQGGAFDGAYGVLAAIECVRRLREVKPEGLDCPIEVIAFADEEGRFIDLLGSRAMAGQLDPGEIAGAVDKDGHRLLDLLKAQGLSSETLLAAERPSAALLCYAELHIEQGRRLERLATDIGLVTGIAGIARCRIAFTGQSNHAGTTAMEDRRDALSGLARFIDRSYAQLQTSGGESRMTFGTAHVEPNVLNVVPGAATVFQEIRDAAWRVCQDLRATTAGIARNVAADMGLDVEVTLLNDDLPVPLSSRQLTLIEECAAALGYSSCRMPSWASHDAQAMAARWPSTMMFVPSRGGISHHPDEHSTAEQLTRGANLLLNWLVSAATNRKEDI